MMRQISCHIKVTLVNPFLNLIKAHFKSLINYNHKPHFGTHREMATDSMLSEPTVAHGYCFCSLTNPTPQDSQLLEFHH